MHGEINVSEIMSRHERLQLWQARQARDAEWVALKQWWRAQRRVARASDAKARRHALREQARAVQLYRAELRRAWPKWRQVQHHLRGRT
jgi:hypothetical protein